MSGSGGGGDKYATKAHQEVLAVNDFVDRLGKKNDQSYSSASALKAQFIQRQRAIGGHAQDQPPEKSVQKEVWLARQAAGAASRVASQTVAAPLPTELNDPELNELLEFVTAAGVKQGIIRDVALKMKNANVSTADLLDPSADDESWRHTIMKVGLAPGVEGKLNAHVNNCRMSNQKRDPGARTTRSTAVDQVLANSQAIREAKPKVRRAASPLAIKGNNAQPGALARAYAAKQPAKPAAVAVAGTAPVTLPAIESTAAVQQSAQPASANAKSPTVRSTPSQRGAQAEASPAAVPTAVAASTVALPDDDLPDDVEDSDEEAQTSAEAHTVAAPAPAPAPAKLSAAERFEAMKAKNPALAKLEEREIKTPEKPGASRIAAAAQSRARPEMSGIAEDEPEPEAKDTPRTIAANQAAKEDAADEEEKAGASKKLQKGQKVSDYERVCIQIVEKRATRILNAFGDATPQIDNKPSQASRFYGKVFHSTRLKAVKGGRDKKVFIDQTRCDAKSLPLVCYKGIFHPVEWIGPPSKTQGEVLLKKAPPVFPNKRFLEPEDAEVMSIINEEDKKMNKKVPRKTFLSEKVTLSDGSEFKNPDVYECGQFYTVEFYQQQKRRLALRRLNARKLQKNFQDCIAEREQRRAELADIRAEMEEELRKKAESGMLGGLGGGLADLGGGLGDGIGSLGGGLGDIGSLGGGLGGGFGFSNRDDDQEGGDGQSAEARGGADGTGAGKGAGFLDGKADGDEELSATDQGATESGESAEVGGWGMGGLTSGLGDLGGGLADLGGGLTDGLGDLGGGLADIGGAGLGGLADLGGGLTDIAGAGLGGLADLGGGLMDIVPGGDLLNSHSAISNMLLPESEDEKFCEIQRRFTVLKIAVMIQQQIERRRRDDELAAMTKMFGSQHEAESECGHCGRAYIWHRHLTLGGSSAFGKPRKWQTHKDMRQRSAKSLWFKLRLYLAFKSMQNKTKKDVLEPHTRRMRKHDVLVNCAIIFSFIYAGLDLAFGFPADMWALMIMLITVADFVMLYDVMMGFKTAFYRLNEATARMILETHTEHIEHFYKNTNFYYDLALAMPMEQVVLLVYIPASGQTFRAFTLHWALALFLKLPRLLRFRRFGRVKHKVIRTPRTMIFQTMSTTFFQFFAVACLYYYYTSMVQPEIGGPKALVSSTTSDFGNRFSAAYYWAITTLKTPAYQPATNYERVFMIFETLVGQILFAMFMAKTALLIGQMNAASGALGKALAAMNNVIRNHQVTGTAATQMRSFVSLAQRYASMQPNDVINDLPPSVKTRVQRDQYQKMINECPLFDPIRSNNNFGQFLNVLVGQLNPISVTKKQVFHQHGIFVMPEGGRMELLDGAFTTDEYLLADKYVNAVFMETSFFGSFPDDSPNGAPSLRCDEDCRILEIKLSTLVEMRKIFKEEVESLMASTRQVMFEQQVGFKNRLLYNLGKELGYAIADKCKALDGKKVTLPIVEDETVQHLRERTAEHNFLALCNAHPDRKPVPKGAGGWGLDSSAAVLRLSIFDRAPRPHKQVAEIMDSHGGFRRFKVGDTFRIDVATRCFHCVHSQNPAMIDKQVLCSGNAVPFPLPAQSSGLDADLKAVALEDTIFNAEVLSDAIYQLIDIRDFRRGDKTEDRVVMSAKAFSQSQGSLVKCEIDADGLCVTYQGCKYNLRWLLKPKVFPLVGHDDVDNERLFTVKKCDANAVVLGGGEMFVNPAMDDSLGGQLDFLNCPREERLVSSYLEEVAAGDDDDDAGSQEEEEEEEEFEAFDEDDFNRQQGEDGEQQESNEPGEEGADSEAAAADPAAAGQDGEEPGKLSVPMTARTDHESPPLSARSVADSAVADLVAQTAELQEEEAAADAARADEEVEQVCLYLDGGYLAEVHSGQVDDSSTVDSVKNATRGWEPQQLELWYLVVMFFGIYSIIFVPVVMFIGWVRPQELVWFDTFVDFIFWIEIYVRGRTGFWQNRGRVPVMVLDLNDIWAAYSGNKKSSKGKTLGLSARLNNFLNSKLCKDMLMSVPVDLIIFCVQPSPLYTFRLQLIKLFHLLRISKVQRRLNGFRKGPASIIGVLVFNLILFCSFVGSCTFYIGNLDTNKAIAAKYSAQVWFEKAKMTSDVPSRFVTSLFWAFTAILKTPIYKPQTHIERLWMAMIVVLGVAVNAMLFGAIVGQIKGVEAKSLEKRNKKNLVKTFMKTNKLPDEISRKMETYVDIHHAVQYMRIVDDAEIAKLAPDVKLNIFLQRLSSYVQTSSLFNDFRRSTNENVRSGAFVRRMAMIIRMRLCVEDDFLRKAGDQISSDCFLVPPDPDFKQQVRVAIFGQRVVQMPVEGSLFGSRIGSRSSTARSSPASPKSASGSARVMGLGDGAPAEDDDEEGGEMEFIELDDTGEQGQAGSGHPATMHKDESSPLFEEDVRFYDECRIVIDSGVDPTGSDKDFRFKVQPLHTDTDYERCGNMLQPLNVCWVSDPSALKDGEVLTYECERNRATSVPIVKGVVSLICNEEVVGEFLNPVTRESRVGHAMCVVKSEYVVLHKAVEGEEEEQKSLEPTSEVMYTIPFFSTIRAEKEAIQAMTDIDLMVVAHKSITGELKKDFQHETRIFEDQIEKMELENRCRLPHNKWAPLLPSDKRKQEEEELANAPVIEGDGQEAAITAPGSPQLAGLSARKFKSQRTNRPITARKVGSDEESRILTADDIDFLSFIFSLFDADDSEAIEVPELQVAFRALGKDKSTTEVQDIMDKFDDPDDPNGEMELDEFIVMMAQENGKVIADDPPLLKQIEDAQTIVQDSEDSGNQAEQQRMKAAAEDAKAKEDMEEAKNQSPRINHDLHLLEAGDGEGGASQRSQDGNSSSGERPLQITWITDDIEPPRVQDRLAINPKHWLKQTWDFLVLFICIPMVFFCVPITLFFLKQGDPIKDTFEMLATMSDWVYIIDILLTFWTGFMVESAAKSAYLCRELSVIRTRYLRGGFAQDFISIVPVYAIAQAVGLTGGALGWASFAQDCVRITRSPRLIHLYRTMVLWSGNSPYQTFVNKFFHPIFFPFILVAFGVGGIFWWVGEAEWNVSGGMVATPAGTPWTQTYFVDDSSDSLLSNVLSSIYWALTSLMKAPIYAPLTNNEKIYTVLVQIIGGVLFALVNGKTAGAVASLQLKGTERWGKLQDILRVVRACSLPKEMHHRMEQYVEQSINLAPRIIGPNSPLKKLENPTGLNEIKRNQFQFLIKFSLLLQSARSRKPLLDAILRSLEWQSVLKDDPITEDGVFCLHVFIVPQGGKVAMYRPAEEDEDGDDDGEDSSISASKDDDEDDGETILAFESVIAIMEESFCFGLMTAPTVACDDIEVLKFSQSNIFSLVMTFPILRRHLEKVSKIMKTIIVYDNPEMNDQFDKQTIDDLREEVVNLEQEEIDTYQEFAAVAINSAEAWKDKQRSEVARLKNESGGISSVVMGHDSEGKMKWDDDLPRGVRNPTALSTERWDMFMMFMIAYNVLFSLLTVSWRRLKNDSSDSTYIIFWCMDSFSDVVFFFDMYLSSKTAYMEPVLGGKAKQVIEKKVIRARYMKVFFWGSTSRAGLDGELFHSFPLDLAACLINYLVWGLSFEVSAGWAVYFGLNRFFRIIRFSRISRLIDAYDNTIWATQVRLIKVIMIFFCVAHIVACLFFWVGERPLALQSAMDAANGVSANETERSAAAMLHWGWPRKNNISPDVVSEYLSSLYWACSVLLKMPCYKPKTDLERAFQCVCCFVGVMMFAFIMGNVNAIMAKQGVEQKEYQRKMRAAASFCKANQINAKLSRRILEYVDFQYSVWPKRFYFNETLKALPVPMKAEVATHQHKYVLYGSSDMFVQNEMVNGEYFFELSQSEDGKLVVKFKGNSVFGAHGFIKLDHVNKKEVLERGFKCIADVDLGPDASPMCGKWKDGSFDPIEDDSIGDKMDPKDQIYVPNFGVINNHEGLCWLSSDEYAFGGTAIVVEPGPPKLGETHLYKVEGLELGSVQRSDGSFKPLDSGRVTIQHVFTRHTDLMPGQSMPKDVPVSGGSKHSFRNFQEMDVLDPENGCKLFTEYRTKVLGKKFLKIIAEEFRFQVCLQSDFVARRHDPLRSVYIVPEGGYLQIFNDYEEEPAVFPDSLNATPSSLLIDFASAGPPQVLYEKTRHQVRWVDPPSRFVFQARDVDKEMVRIDFSSGKAVMRFKGKTIREAIKFRGDEQSALGTTGARSSFVTEIIPKSETVPKELVKLKDGTQFENILGKVKQRVMFEEVDGAERGLVQLADGSSFLNPGSSSNLSVDILEEMDYFGLINAYVQAMSDVDLIWLNEPAIKRVHHQFPAEAMVLLQRVEERMREPKLEIAAIKLGAATTML